MKRKPMQWIGCGLLLAMLTVACAGAKLTAKPLDSSETAKPVSDILVIVVADRDETRRFFENRFVEALKAAGIDAVASADAIPMPSDLQLKREAILQAVDRFSSRRDQCDRVSA